jgi:hypothetical protein
VLRRRSFQLRLRRRVWRCRLSWRRRGPRLLRGLGLFGRLRRAGEELPGARRRVLSLVGLAVLRALVHPVRLLRSLYGAALCSVTVPCPGARIAAVDLAARIYSSRHAALALRRCHRCGLGSSQAATGGQRARIRTCRFGGSRAQILVREAMGEARRVWTVWGCVKPYRTCRPARR